ncbi:MAG: zf-HC2 domain-containing protein [Eubacterium sp.]|nr:zf-HC2 domain-containing protein [Eubacterium sp.]
MMNEINCSIIKDLLPLYIDDVVSAETRGFMEAHLAHCETCRQEYEKLSQNAAVADNAAVRLREAAPLRSLKKRLQRKRALLVSAALILLILAIVPLPVRISRTLDGVRWEGGTGQPLEECRVTVDGWYYRYLLKDSFFKGDISFTTAEGTVSYHVPNVTLGRDAMYRDRGGSATVYDAAPNRMRALGYLAVTGNFKEIFIRSEEWNFAAPAENLEEALELAGELTVGEWY